jgi:hypothetical protein
MSGNPVISVTVVEGHPNESMVIAEGLQHASRAEHSAGPGVAGYALDAGFK